MFHVCVSCNVLTQKDFNSFCCGFSEDQALDEISRKKEEVERSLVEIFDRTGEFEFDDNFAGEWKNRFEWIAQWKEMTENKEPIGRPRQIYIGKTSRDYVAIDKR